jgi:hypothetical protein
MTKPDMPTFMAEWSKAHDPGAMPGALLMKYGPEDYVGATICVRGTLFFKGAHTPEVREALCLCFDAYEAVATDHLKWLWRDEPPSGPDKFAYVKAPSLRSMMKKMNPDDHVGFAYTGGEKPHDASPWLFFASGLRAWEAKLGWNGLDSLQFSLPREIVEQQPTLFQSLFVTFARLLNAEHGYGGFALNLSLTRTEPNQATEAFMTSKMAGLDAGEATSIAAWHKYGIDDHIAKTGWLTAINKGMVEKVGGLFSLRSALPLDWFAMVDYGAGLVIQAGPAPNIVAMDLDPKPSLHVLPMMALKAVFISSNDDLHEGSHDGEPRLAGAAATRWLRRFEVPEQDLLTYKAKLLGEPKLTKASTLPDSL